MQNKRRLQLRYYIFHWNYVNLSIHPELVVVASARNALTVKLYSTSAAIIKHIGQKVVVISDLSERHHKGDISHLASLIV